MSHTSRSRTHIRGRRTRVAPGMTLGLAFSVGLLMGCDSLVDVDLSGTIATEELDDPSTAAIQVNAVIAAVECAYDRFIAGNAAGNEDIYLRKRASLAPALEYQSSVRGGHCDFGGDGRSTWWDPFQMARFLAEFTYDKLDGWTEAEVETGLSEGYTGREQMMAIVAIYAAIPYEIFGEHLCEVAFSDANGPGFGQLLSPEETLALGAGWIDVAMNHIAAADMTGDFALPYDIASSARAMANGLKARIQWARGDLPGAATAAELVPQDFVAWVTRGPDDSNDRRENHIYLIHTDIRLATVAGPVNWWTGPDGPAGPWPAVIPFTGYLDLGIATDGRAVDASGNPITTTADPMAMADTRVVVTPETLTQGDAGFGQNKYTALDQPIPLVNWQEMWLIRAEANPAQAVGLVNDLRGDAGLPVIGYAPTGGEIMDMIIEERRRALFLEGRFWSMKILNTDKLWFPRSIGLQSTPFGFELGGAVRMLMESAEYTLNTNFSAADRGTKCDADQRPVFTTTS